MTRRTQAGRSVIVALLAGAEVVSLSVLGVPPAQAQDGQGSIVGWGAQVVGVDLSRGFVVPSQDCLDVFDFDADADVDLKDFASFQRPFTGGSE